MNKDNVRMTAGRDEPGSLSEIENLESGKGPVNLVGVVGVTGAERVEGTESANCTAHKSRLWRFGTS